MQTLINIEMETADKFPDRQHADVYTLVSSLNVLEVLQAVCGSYDEVE